MENDGDDCDWKLEARSSLEDLHETIERLYPDLTDRLDVAIWVCIFNRDRVEGFFYEGLGSLRLSDTPLQNLSFRFCSNYGNG